MQRKFAFFMLACSLFALENTSARASTWTELGAKFAGRVSGIVATDAMHVWVSTPGGGVWKSADGGATFVWAGNYALGDFTAVNLALDRSNPARMYLRTRSGVLVSTDGAAHWTRTLYSLPGDTPYPYPSEACSSWPSCPPSAGAYPEDPGPWAQTVFSPTQSLILTSLPCQGLQYSTDGANHFTQLWPFGGAVPQRNPDNCINSIAIDDISRRVWFTTMATLPITIGLLPPHIYRSSAPWTAAGPPAGMTWDPVTTGLPIGEEPTAIVWGGASADNMMALIYGSAYTPYLYNGSTWVAKPISGAGCLPSSLRDARPLIAGGSGADFYVGTVAFAYTLNAGGTWTCPAPNAQYADIRAIFASASAHRLWIGGDQNGLGGNALLTQFTWSPGSPPMAAVPLTASGIASWQAYSVAKASSNRLFVGGQDFRAVCSDDGGISWSATPTDETQALVWAKTAGASTAYAFITKVDMYKATNASSAATCSAISWPNVSPPDALKRVNAFTGPHMLAVDPLHETKVFAINGGRVLYSIDGGTNWHPSDLSLTTATGYPVALSAIFVDELGTVYVGTQDHGVYSCSDTVHYCDASVGADTWMPFGLNPGGPIVPPWYITAITESNPPPAPRTLWVASSQGVYRLLAGSTAWTAADAFYLYPYSDVVVDPTCPSRVYTAIGYLGKSMLTRGGVHFSSDNGAHWTSITSGFPLHNVPITQILVDPSNPQKVYATTYGRGLWRYDWSSLPPCV